jgi:hypothetical protein
MVEELKQSTTAAKTTKGPTEPRPTADEQSAIRTLKESIAGLAVLSKKYVTQDLVAGFLVDVVSAEDIHAAAQLLYEVETQIDKRERAAKEAGIREARAEAKENGEQADREAIKAKLTSDPKKEGIPEFLQTQNRAAFSKETESYIDAAIKRAEANGLKESLAAQTPSPVAPDVIGAATVVETSATPDATGGAR